MCKPLAIAFTVLGFIWWWPVGLAVLLFMIGSGRMGCGRRGDNRQAFWRGGMPFANWRNFCGNGGGGGGGRGATFTSSGNRAFDEYRTETLRRLEQEQTDFAAFLDRLRFAKDKSEFDQFMADRRQNPPPTPPEHPEAPAN